MSQSVASSTSPLQLDDTDLAKCVSCGLCLPHCPTYRATGEEGLSPRGRIDAMRSVHWRGAAIDDGFVRFMETCVQCRGCEPACPSGVPFGRLIETTNSALASSGTVTTRGQRLGLEVLEPIWRHVRDMSPATQSRWQWTWVWDDSVFHKYGEQLQLVGRWWSGQQKRVLSGIDGLLLLVVVGEGLILWGLGRRAGTNSRGRG